MCRCCHHENGQVEFCALTYCSKIGTWRESTFSLHQRTLNSNTPVACNGLLYWLVGGTEEETVDGIFAFDPSKLTDHNPSYGHFVNFPSGLLQGKGRSYDINVRLGLVRGRLRLSQLNISKRKGFVLKIWELNYDNNFNYDNSDDDDDDDDGSSRMWTLVHDVRVKKWIDRRQHVIAFHPENGNVIFLLFNCRHIYQYDIGEEMMEKVGQFSGDGDEICVGDIRTYTLVHPLWPTPIHARPSASASKS
ncbi:hypothetical protein PanWU01x14_215090 [Parasponia andersonii]|uniref:F-box protein At3g26010-like beta-propeller domain-containing protein n=1 Tax=Parasponia andersonii TaxID=3476 RepID=A0A2P5BS03_PARAD|nr:hypothetical protein PanWU01x14_215090 [Parasponia andersonii]